MSLLTLVVRWLHVLAMALALGGAVAVWWAFHAGRENDLTETLAFAAAYEQVFWLAMGVIAATGVGNLGAMAPAIPTTGGWAAAFAVKLGVVLLFVLFSGGRSLGLYRVAVRPQGQVAVRRLRRGYASTALLLVGIVALAEVLAHG